jgi:hypothetical protein
LRLNGDDNNDDDEEVIDIIPEIAEQMSDDVWVMGLHTGGGAVMSSSDDDFLMG